VWKNSLNFVNNAPIVYANFVINLILVSEK